MMHSRSITALAAILVSTTALTGKTTERAVVLRTGYERNVGQIVDECGNPNRNVLYLFRSKGYNLQLRSDGFSYDVFDRNGYPDVDRIDIDFQNIEVEPVIVEGEILPGEYHYYRGATVDSMVSTVCVSSVLYRNIAPGISIQFKTSSANGPEYDILIDPGADLTRLSLRYRGVDSISVESNAVVLYTSNGILREMIPKCWEASTGRLVIVTPSLAGSTVSFRAESYDVASGLVIDPVPVLDWGTYFGGSNSDGVADLVALSDGGLVVVGTTSSTSNIATVGAYKTTLAGNSDVFVARFTSTGTLTWCTYYGGPNQDVGKAVAGSIALGYVYIGGSTQSTSGIATSGAHQTVHRGQSDVFMLKLNLSGTPAWASYYGGTSTESINDVALTSGGDVYAVGNTNSSSLATTGAPKQTPGGYDAFLMEWESNGQMSFFTYFGGTGTDVLMSVYSYGNSVYSAGYTNSTSGIATSGAHKTTYGGGTYDAMLATVNTSNGIVWATYLGGSGSDQCLGSSITVRDSRIYVSGQTTSSSGIATINTHQLSYQGNTDAFIDCFTVAGVRLWGTYIGGSGTDVAAQITTSDDSTLLIIGSTTSTSGIASATAFQKTLAGDQDMAVWSFRTNGTRRWSTYMGGTGYETGNCVISANNSGSLILGGNTRSTSGMSSSRSHQTAFGGVTDGFLARLNVECEAKPDISGPDTVCVGEMYRYSSPSVTGNTYSWTDPIKGDIIASSTSNEVMIRWTQVGTEILRLTQTIPGDCSSTAQLSVVIKPRIDETVFSENGFFECCDGDTIRLTAIDTSVTYRWNTGDTTRSIVVTQSGVYSVELSNGACTKSSIGVQVTVRPLPSPAITGDSISCLNENAIVQYSTPFVPGHSYLWTTALRFGRYLSSTDQSTATIQWNSRGVETLVVRETTSSNCTASSSYQVRIYDPVALKILPSDNGTEFCVGNVVVLDASSGYVSYEWSTGEQTRQINATTTGAYYVKAFDGICTTISDTIHLTFRQNPSPLIIGQEAICLADNTTMPYTTAFVQGNAYQWKTSLQFGQYLTPTNGPSVTIVWKNKGVETLQVEETTIFNCMVTTSLGVRIDDWYYVLISRSNNDSVICEGGVVQLDAGPGYSRYKWSTGADTRMIDVSKSGSYYVNVSNGTCSGSSDTVTLEFRSKPEPKISGPSSLCLSSASSVTYNVSARSGNAINWRDLNLGTIIGPRDQANVTVAWNVAGRDTMRVVETAAFDCETQAEYVVDIDATEIIPVITGPAEICLDDENDASYTIQPGVGNTVLWTQPVLGTVSTPLTSPTIAIAWHTEGLDTLRVTETNAALCTGFATQVVVIHKKIRQEDIGVTVGLTEIVVDSVGGALYQWLDEGGGEVPGATSRRFTPPDEGFYHVRITIGLCVTVSDPIQFKIIDTSKLVTVYDVDFGTVPVDDLINANGGHVNEIVVVNGSSLNLRIDSASIDDTVFTIPEQFPRQLGPGDTSRISTRFRPTAFEKYTGNITVFLGSEIATAHVSGIGRALISTDRISEVLLIPERLEVEPGETFDIVMYLGDERPEPTTATEFSATLQWDSRVLELVSTPDVYFSATGREDNYYTAKIPQATRIAGQRELIRLPFRAKLADVDSTIIVFTGPFAFQWKDATTAYPACRDSVVRIRVCQEGGKRLITKREIQTLSIISPHPIGDEATVTILSTDRSRSTLEIIDPIGVIVQQIDLGIMDTGINEVRIDMSKFPPGPYILRLRGPWKDDSRVVIHR